MVVFNTVLSATALARDTKFVLHSEKFVGGRLLKTLVGQYLVKFAKLLNTLAS